MEPVASPPPNATMAPSCSTRPIPITAKEIAGNQADKGIGKQRLTADATRMIPSTRSARPVKREVSRTLVRRAKGRAIGRAFNAARRHVSRSIWRLRINAGNQSVLFPSTIWMEMKSDGNPKTMLEPYGKGSMLRRPTKSSAQPKLRSPKPSSTAPTLFPSGTRRVPTRARPRMAPLRPFFFFFKRPYSVGTACGCLGNSILRKTGPDATIPFPW